MASGFFPINARDEEGAKLMEAIRLIEEVRSTMRESIALYCVPEDAERDGAYMERLTRAVSEIAPCLDGYVSHRAVCQKVQSIVNDFLPPDSGIEPRECISRILEVLDGPDWRTAERGYPA